MEIMPRRRSAAQLDREIAQALSPAGRSSASYRVAYLVPNPRRGQPGQETMLMLWWTEQPEPLDDALANLSIAKRRGITAWVADAHGRHVPVRGATRPYPGRYSVRDS